MKKIQVNYKKFIIWFISLALSLTLIVWVEYAIGWDTVIKAWSGFSWPTLLVLIALSALSYLFRALRVYDHFSEQKKFSDFLPILQLSVQHTAANNLLPMRTGEAAFPLLMKYHFNVSIVDSTLTLLWFRLLDLYCLGLFALYFLASYSIALYLGLVLAALGVLALLLPLQFWLKSLLQHRSHRLARLLMKILSTLPIRPRIFFGAILWTLLIWLSKFAAFSLVVAEFIDAPLWQILLGISSAELSSVLPIHGVAGTGTYEGAMVLALNPLGVATDQALLAAVNLHLFLLSCTVIFGIAVTLFIRRPALSVAT